MRPDFEKILLAAFVFLFLSFAWINNAQAVTLTPANGSTFTAANEFQSYTSSNLRASGCIGGTYTWTAASLPTGLSLSSLTGTNNTFTGSPTQSGSFTFTVTAKNSGAWLCFGGTSATYTYYITVNPRCRFSGGTTGSIAFSIDPTQAGPLYNSIVTNLSFQCGPGTTYSYTISPAQPNLTGSNNTIPYTLSAGQGLAALGQNTSDSALIPLLTTLSQVLRADYQNAYAETDTSTETVTISWTGAAAGSLTATITATGIVQNACSMSGTPALAFGTLDAVTNAGGATATVTPPSIMCTMGGSAVVSNDGGLNYSGTPRLKDSSTNYINYNINYTTPLTGAGGTTDIGGSGAGHLSMGATIPASALDNAPAGTYGDTVNLTISY